MSGKYKNKYRIESNRLQTWDYSSPGGYFLTVCINGREEILGYVQKGRMRLSDAGKIVANHLIEIPEYHPRVILVQWVVMPNHIHCIIVLGDYDFHNAICTRVVPVEKIHEFSLRNRNEQDIIEYRKKRRQMLIPKIMGKFQMLTSKQINILNQTPGKKNWQPNYHDRIIRNENEFNRIQQYIINNPVKWETDRNNQDGLWI